MAYRPSTFARVALYLDCMRQSFVDGELGRELAVASYDMLPEVLICGAQFLAADAIGGALRFMLVLFVIVFVELRGVAKLTRQAHIEAWRYVDERLGKNN